MRPAIALLLAAVTSGCIRTVEEREIIVERLIDPAPIARALPVCALPALGDTTGWREHRSDRLSLPPEFEVDTVASRRIAAHAAKYWIDDSGRTFTRTTAHWDVSDHPDACHSTVNGALMVILIGSDSSGHWVDAWPVSRSATMTPRFDAVGFDPVDQQLFLRILQTYRAPDDE